MDAGLTELLGYAAAGLVLATFCMRDMLSLRVVAIASNIAFISYGALAEISPVLLLHVVLLPVNTQRHAYPPLLARTPGGAQALLRPLADCMEEALRAQHGAA